MTTFTLLVPDDRIGRVIGKGGSGLERIRCQTMCSVTVHRESIRGERTVELTGTDVQLTRAQIMIMEATQDQGGDKRKHSTVEQYPPPIMQQHHHQQHRAMFNGEGPDHSAAAAAQAQAVAVAAAAGGPWGMAMPPPFPRMHPGHQHHFQPRQMVVPFHPGSQHGGGAMARAPTVAKLLIDDKRAGCIIGKAAVGLAELRESTGAHFELARHPLLLGQRMLAIHPPYAAQERCIMLVCEKLGASAASQHASSAAAVVAAGETAVDSAAAAGGAPSPELLATTGADSSGEAAAAAAAAPTPSAAKKTTQTTPADAEAAAVTAATAAAGSPELQSITVRMILPVNMIGRVVEKGGSGLKSLREQGLYVNLPREDDPKPGERLLTLRGPAPNVGMGICSVLMRMG